MIKKIKMISKELAVGGILFLGLFVLAGLVYASYRYVVISSDYSPEISLPIILIAGVVILVIFLTITAAVMTALGLSNSEFAFGMPEGTIRAVLALSLVLIFSIVSLFLYDQLRTPVNTVLDCLTAEQIANFEDPNRLLFIGDSRNPRCPPDTLYVRVSLEQNETSEDFAKQILTTVSTLVVAVAGFYFGSRAVATARGVAAPVSPLIRSINPAKGTPGQPPIEEIEILGKNFNSPQSVKLVRGSHEMSIENVMSSPTRIQGRLVIPEGQKAGWYELLVINADGGEDRLSEAFEVKEEEEAEPTGDGGE